MAITSAQMQTALGDAIGDPRVIRHHGVAGLLQGWTIVGGDTVGHRVRTLDTTAADDAATQAAAAVVSLRA